MAIDDILIPVDFSGNSRNALKYGIEVAQRTSARLVILHAYRLLGSPIDPGANSRSYQKEHLDKNPRENFKIIEQQLLKKSGLEYEFLVEIGFIETVIKLVAINQPVDMVVMGTRGENQYGNFLGSTTTQVIKDLDCPVLAVPAGVKFRDIRNILLVGAIDENDPSRIKNITDTITGIFESKIHWLNLHASSPVNPQALQEHHIFKYQEQPVESSRGISSSTVNRYVKDNRIDLLIVIPENSGMVESLYQKKIPSSTRIPFLSVH